jgi:hypothetical protein
MPVASAKTTVAQPAAHDQTPAAARVRHPTPATKPQASPRAITKPKAPAEPVSDAKLREVHARFLEASKTAGAPNVSFDGLAKSLRAAEAKLRAQHGNRRIDFEVILKDGKPIVKPVVR